MAPRVFSLSLFLYGAVLPLIGRLVDRFGARPVIAGGVLVLSGSLAATGLVTAPDEPVVHKHLPGSIKPLEDVAT